MHRLVPSLITENLRKEILRGGFDCAAMFVDISGFTVLTETLMQHGQYGAEVLAVVMRAIFSPVVRSVYEQGGYVVNYAGDAITAVFPMEEHNQSEAVICALAAAQQIQAYMADNDQKTRFGTFVFTAKVGLAAGTLEWGTLLSPNKRRAIYYFKGSAITGCADAEQVSRAGDIILNDAAFDLVRTRVLARPTSGHWRITTALSTLPEPQAIDLPPPDVEKLMHFYPRSLVEDPIIGEFRQVLNLFVNLQGTPNHAAIENFVEQVFTLQKKYGGLINRLDFSDKGCHLVLFWGAPISYENDVTRALDFILELREKSLIPLRAGMTYRIAHAGFIGSDLAEEYTCYGRGVNLAARQMTSAAWGEIWVDGETAHRAEREFGCESLGLKQFKGFADSQPVYLLTGEREDRLSPFADRVLVGRRSELVRLRHAIQPIYEGHFAGVIAVVGEAGIGKSRLVYELLEPVAAAGKAAIFLCQTDEIIRQSLNPFRYFLRHYFDQSYTRDEAGNKNRFEEILGDLLAALPDGHLRNELERTTSFLGSLVGLFWAGSLYDQLDPELRFENSLNALKTLFRAESRIQPVIIQLEDAHWLDADSSEFLNRLTRNMASFPLVLLVTSREDIASDRFDPDVPVEVINLQALDEQGLEDMARAIIHDQPSPELLAFVQERTEGNPFYAEQLLLYLQENDLLDTISNQARGVLPGDVYIPTNVRALLTARLDRLPTPVKEVVQNAAVLGREFEAPILSDMVANDPSLAERLQLAEDEAIWMALDDDRYLFQHTLLRDAAYDMQIHSRLLIMHKLAAKAFENRHLRDPDLSPRFPEIAYHFERAEESLPASRYYGAAGEQAKENYSNLEAVGYFTRGLELLDKSDIPSRVNYLCGRETVCQWMGRRDAQKADLALIEELLDQHPDLGMQVDLALRQSAFALVTGDYAAAINRAKDALDISIKMGEPAAQARAYHRLGRTLWEQGDSQPAEGFLIKALDLARAGQNVELEAKSLYDLSMVYRIQVRYEESMQYLDRAAAAFEEMGDEQGIIRCLNLRGLIDYDKGSFEDSNQQYLNALHLCRRIGWRYAETHILLNIGGALFDLGDYDRSRLYENQALSLSRETGDHQAEAVSLDTLGLIDHYQGNPAQAVAYYNQALRIHQTLQNKREYGYALTHLGYALVAEGQYETAESYLLQAMQVRQDLGTKGLEMDTMGGLALAAFTSGALEKAVQIVADILAYIDENGIDGIELPIQVYLICYLVLSEKAKREPGSSHLAESVLDAGHALLKARASQLQDSEMRRRFMEQVPYNRQLHRLWLQSRPAN